MTTSNDDAGTPGARRRVSRRKAIGLAALGVGGAAAAWRAVGQEQPGPPTGDPTETAVIPSAPSTPDAASETTTEVGEDGFDISHGAVRVSAPAGVAPAGTPIAVRSPGEALAGDFSPAGRFVGPSVSVVLGGGMQPQQPISIVFDLTGTEVAASVSNESPLAVISRAGTPASWVLLPGTWDARTQTLSVTTDHLSPFGLFQFDLDTFLDDLFLELLGLRFERPDDAYNTLRLDDRTYSILLPDTGDHPMWPVLRAQSGQIVLELHSASPLPWAATTVPSQRGQVRGQFKDLDPSLAALFQGLSGLMGRDRTAVMPGDITSFRFDPTSPPTKVTARTEPGLLLATTLSWAVLSILDIFFPAEKGTRAKEVLDSLGAFDCVGDIINTSYGTDAVAIGAGTVRSALTCLTELFEDAAKGLGRIVAAAAATILGLLLGGVSLLVGYLDGFLREMTGTGTYAIAITSNADAPAVTSTATAATPSDRHGPSLDAPIAVRWRFGGLGYINAPPAIADGTVYVAADLYALDHATGRERWHVGSLMEAPASPAVSNGLVLLYTAMRDVGGLLQAFDTRSGTERWRYGEGGGHESAPAVWNGIAYVQAHGELHALDVATGNERGRVRGSVAGTPVIVEDAVYIRGAGGTLLALDAATGSERWSFPLTPSIFVPAIASGANGVVCATSDSGHMHVIDAGTGSELWRYERTPESRSVPCVADGLVFVDRGPHFAALDVSTGRERWSFSTGTDAEFPAQAVADGIVYAASRDRLFALDARTGTELWRFDGGPETGGSPVIAVAEGIVCASLDGTTLVTLGNVEPIRLVEEVVIRGAPAPSGVERGRASAGNTVTSLRTREVRQGTWWTEATIGGVTGWIPLDAIDPTTLPPDGDIEYVYTPD